MKNFALPHTKVVTGYTWVQAGLTSFTGYAHVENRFYDGEALGPLSTSTITMASGFRRATTRFQPFPGTHHRHRLHLELVNSRTAVTGLAVACKIVHTRRLLRYLKQTDDRPCSKCVAVAKGQTYRRRLSALFPDSNLRTVDGEPRTRCVRLCHQHPLDRVVFDCDASLLRLFKPSAAVSRSSPRYLASPGACLCRLGSFTSIPQSARCGSSVCSAC